MNMLAKRRAAIAQGLEDARIAAEARANAEAEARQIIAKAQSEAAERVREATQRAEAVALEVKAEAEGDAVKIREEALADSAIERERLLGGRDHAADCRHRRHHAGPEEHSGGIGDGRLQ